MPTVIRILILSSLLVPLLIEASTSIFAQSALATEEQRKLLFDKHQSDLDYLLGDWEFFGVRKTPEGGELKLHGYMSAARFPLCAEILSQDRFVNDDRSTFFTSSTQQQKGWRRDLS